METQLMQEHEVLSKVSIDLLPPIAEITEQNFWRFLNYKEDRKDLERRVINRFEPTIFAKTGYSDKKRPEVEVEDPIKVPNSDLEFLVKTKPTTKRPAYSQVNVEFGNYLRFLLERYQQGIQQKGVITISKEPYVLVDNLIEKLEGDLEIILEGKEGISQSLTCPPQPSVERITIDLNRDYSQFTLQTVMAFIAASQLKDQSDKSYNEFKSLLKKDSLERLGESPDHPVIVTYPFEGAVFRHHLEPRISVKHSEIINTAFLKDSPERIARNSRIGDLKVARLINNQELAQTLREKGILNKDYISSYNPSVRDNQVYVRLEGVISRLETYNGVLTTHSLEQNFSIRPIL